MPALKLPLTTVERLERVEQGLLDHVRECNSRMKRLEKLAWAVLCVGVYHVDWSHLLNKLLGVL